MNYVERNSEGEIVSIYTSPQEGKDLEYIDIGNQELIDFLNKKPEPVES